MVKVKILAIMIILIFVISTSFSGFSVTSEEENCDCGNQESESNIAPDAAKGLGCIPEPVVQGEAMALYYPPAWDWRNQGVMTSVKNQAGCGSCVAFGTIGAFEAVIRINGGPSLDLSEADLFYCGCGYCCGTGWYGSHAVNRLYHYGVPDEACFPYRDYNIPCDPCDDREDRIEKPSDYGYLSSESSIKSAIYNYGPVISSFAVWSDFYYDYTGGVYHYEYGRLEGYHCIAVVGYNDNSNYWICKNSWGGSWGESGYFRIGYGEVQICQSAYYLDYTPTYLIVNAGGPYLGGINTPIQFEGSAAGGEPPYTWHWDFGDGATSDIQNPTHTYDGSGEYIVTLTVTDNIFDTDDDETRAEITNAPDTPTKPTGPISGYQNTEYTYTTVTTDPSGANVRYGWDWDGDAITDEWTGYYSSGTPVSLSHSFSTSGQYFVQVKARNNIGGISGFSPFLKVHISDVNQQPNTPSDPYPEDNAEDTSLDVDLSWICTDPDAGDSLTYDVYFGTTNPPPKVSGNHPENTYALETLEPGITYYWKITAWDTHGTFTESPLWQFTTEGEPNLPPNTPQINGPTSGKPGGTYLYKFIASDPDGDDLHYYIDWDDGTVEDWIGHYSSNEEIEIYHMWTTSGTYKIRAKVKDSYEESDWVTFDVSMTKSRAIALNVLLKLLERFPIIARLFKI